MKKVLYTRALFLFREGKKTEAEEWSTWTEETEKATLLFLGGLLG